MSTVLSFTEMQAKQNRIYYNVRKKIIRAGFLKKYEPTENLLVHDSFSLCVRLFSLPFVGNFYSLETRSFFEILPIVSIKNDVILTRQKTRGSCYQSLTKTLWDENLFLMNSCIYILKKTISILKTLTGLYNISLTTSGVAISVVLLLITR